MDFKRSLLREEAFERTNFAAYMSISLGCHVIVMVFLAMMSGFSGCERYSFSSRVIDVDLISPQEMADAGGRIAEPALSGPENAPSQVSITPALRKIIGMAAKNPAERVKTSLKSKTFNSGQSVENAVARLEKKMRQKAPDESVAGAIARLRQAEQDKRRSVTVSGRGGPGGNRTRQELEAIDIYKLEIRYHILNNWVFSSQLAGTDKGLKTVIGITIAADGRITGAWYDKRSGNSYFDESAYKAVLKSDPLPELPEGLSSYTVGLEFTPSDMR